MKQTFLNRKKKHFKESEAALLKSSDTHQYRPPRKRCKRQNILVRSN